MLIVCGAVNIDAYLDNVKYVVYNVVYIPFNLCYIFYVLPFHIIFIIKQTFNLKQYTRHHLLRELIIFQEIFLPLSMSVEDWNMSGLNWKWITLLKNYTNTFFWKDYHKSYHKLFASSTFFLINWHLYIFWNEKGKIIENGKKSKLTVKNTQSVIKQEA